MATPADAAPSPPTADKKPHDPAGVLAGAPGSVKEAAKSPEDAAEVTAQGESAALDFLLGPTEALRYDVPVTYDTSKGPAKLVFVISQLDGSKIIELEKEHRKGSGPFAEVDDIALNAAIVAEAAVEIRDKVSGRTVKVNSEEFRGGVPSTAIAMQTRFKFQPGLLDGVAGEIRRISGYAPDRVGEAASVSERQTIADAVGNS